MAKDALLAGFSEYIGNARIIAPGDRADLQRGLLSIRFEQISRPTDAILRPCLYGMAAKTVNENDVYAAIIVRRQIEKDMGTYTVRMPRRWLFLCPLSENFLQSGHIAAILLFL